MVMKKKIKESFGYSEIEQLKMQIKSFDININKLMREIFLQMQKQSIKPFFNKTMGDSSELVAHRDPQIRRKLIALKSMEDKVNELYDILDSMEQNDEK